MLGRPRFMRILQQRAARRTSSGNAADPNVFMLTKSSGKLVWAEQAADMDDRVKQVDVISYADPVPCYQTIDVETGRAFSYPPPEGFEYQLTPENCDSGFYYYCSDHVRCRVNAR